MQGSVFHKIAISRAFCGIMEEIPEICHLHWQKSHETPPLERHVLTLHYARVYFVHVCPTERYGFRRMGSTHIPNYEASAPPPG